VRGGEPYLFDCGPGSLDALEEAGLSFRAVRRVFLTHYHPDHTLGLGRLLAALHVDEHTNGTEPLTIHGPEGLTGFIDRWRALYRSTAPKGTPPDLVEVRGVDAYSGGGVEVRAVAADHSSETALSYRFEADGASIVYTGDTEYTESLVEFSRGADLLVAECSVPDEREMAGHMIPSTIGKLAAGAAVGRVVLVHMYPVFGAADPAAPVRRIFKGTVTVAGDGMKIEV
jgi:ribonuclease BN (tRNA processing enzyme)